MCAWHDQIWLTGMGAQSSQTELSGVFQQLQTLHPEPGVFSWLCGIPLSSTHILGLGSHIRECKRAWVMCNVFSLVLSGI